MAENQRFLALDVFRGMTVCFMIIVNSPGDWNIAYPPLLHAVWHGFTPTDLVFPSFLFAVGNAMAFVMYKYAGQDGNGLFWRKTLKRFAIIFLLGFLMYWFPYVDFHTWTLKPFAETRILGVLQRIAICYLVASVVVYYGSKTFVVVFSIAALLAYWIILYTLGDAVDPYSMTGYAGNALDKLLLGEAHMYHGEGVAFEPEGILSTLPSLVNVIAGYLAGDFIRRKGVTYETLAKLLMVGAVLIFVALTWNMVFPINKKIWTSSFVLLTVGLDLLLIPLLLYVVEMMQRTKWTGFFVVFGKNPLFIYLLSELLLITFYLIPVGESNVVGWLFHNVFGSVANPVNASFLFAFFFMMICWVVGYLLNKKKIYIRV